jgi:hypothetical protein
MAMSLVMRWLNDRGCRNEARHNLMMRFEP